MRDSRTITEAPSGTSKQIDIGLLADRLQEKMTVGGFQIKRTNRSGAVVVEGTSTQYVDSLIYVIGTKGVYGPNPNDHIEHNGYNLVVQSIDEALLTLGLDFRRHTPRVRYEKVAPEF